MENEIRVGEYLKLDDGTIGKYQIDKNWNNVVEINDKCIGFDIEKDIVKHSSNLIDLIECGDYVNGKKVREIKEWNSSKDGYFRYAVTCHYEIIRADEIETIVTKEMMETISYKVKQEEK